MGSQNQNYNLAYIAGFLDGDGSLMLQVKKRHDIKSGWRLMATICFYQDSRHDKSLSWIRNRLGIGYISKRRDGITELRINGYRQVEQILKRLLPYIRFKKKQTKIMIKALGLLIRMKSKNLKKRNMLRLVGYLLKIQNYNYKSHQKKSRQELLKRLGLTP